MRLKVLLQLLCIASVATSVNSRVQSKRRNSLTFFSFDNELHKTPLTGNKTNQLFNFEPSNYESVCLAAHNRYRSVHNTPHLQYSKEVSDYAKWRAQTIANSDGDEFKHINGPYGENLAWHSQPSTNCLTFTQMWYNEERLYDYNNPRFSMKTGHFTQLVWLKTIYLGCAEAVSLGRKGGRYLVCNYYPPGNVQGQFGENVKRPKRRSRLKQKLAAKIEQYD